MQSIIRLVLVSHISAAFAAMAATGDSQLVSPAGSAPVPLVVKEWTSSVSVKPSELNEGEMKWLQLGGAGPAKHEVTYSQSGLDLSRFERISVPVRNRGQRPLLAWFCVGDTNRPARHHSDRVPNQIEAMVPPDGSVVWLSVVLGGKESASFAGKLISFRAPLLDFQRPESPDSHGITGLLLGLNRTGSEDVLEFGPVVAHGSAVPLRDLTEREAFPLFDEFGQYRHRSWPDKVRGNSDFSLRNSDELLDLMAHPRPSSWNEYGGWATGPRLKATGFFRVEKHEGKWWFVDPVGNLFWSHGVVRVGTRILVGGVYRGSPVAGREYLFELPERSSPVGQFFGTEPAATRGHYVDQPNHAIYDFLEANLFRKYGSKWRSLYAERAQARLASWGLNSIANSSDPAVYLLRRTPYTAIVYSAPLGSNEHRIEGSDGNWGKLPDPFDPGWRSLMARTLTTSLKDSLNDPWCIGFFVDNELHWGDEFHVAESVLRSPPNQAAKAEFAKRLKGKFDSIEALNRAWGTTFKDWEEWTNSTTTPGKRTGPMEQDLRDFSAVVVDAYFKGCRDAVRAATPNHLYLGARFSGFNAAATMAAAKYCDVISINHYFPTVDLESPLHGADERPILIGEFHFGALDRGPIASALQPVMDQDARAEAYSQYVASALRNPAVIGTHWFQFYDQPHSGRFDGENLQAGLVDITDTPYRETVDACRAIAREMYDLRYGTK